MAWSDVSDREAVLAAVDEYDRLGARAFHTNYGYKAPRTQALVIDGREYPSKAILGVAHGFQFPELGPLKSNEFTGGEHTVKRVLTGLDFVVREPRGNVSAATSSPPPDDARREHEAEAATVLRVGEVYSRGQLREQFGIVDATINNGVFPFSQNEIWLFVTERKTPDRTQFEDRLVGDKLYWDGQTSGRTDGLIIDHERRRARLLVFYREDRFRYPGAGFRYEGEFTYQEHSGSNPTHFVLARAQPLAAAPEIEVDVETFIRGRRWTSALSAGDRRSIEQHAVGVATAHYRALGWTVTDVGETHSYDLRCMRDGVELHVEVKGTTRDGQRVTLTSAEVDHARRYPRVALFVVRGVELTKDEAGNADASGGEQIIYDPWRVDDGVLEELAFRYTLPALPASASHAADNLLS